MKLIIEDDEGRKTVVPLVREEITIGRQDGNTIRLTERNVSRRHARLVKDNGALLIEDLGSYNGVRVNGDRIQGPTKVKEGDLIEIGDYDLGIQGKFEAPLLQQAPITNSGTRIPKAAPAAAPAAMPRPATAPAPAASASAAAPALSEPVSEPAAPAPAPQLGGLTPASAGGATAIIRVSDIMKSQPQVEVQDLAKNQMPRLVGLSGPVRGKEFYLMRTEVKVGRTEENDIGIDHQSMSRQHCRFVLDQGTWKVYDNKSANGVRINGEEYAVSAVKPGDTIELGHLKFRFCAPGEKFSAPTEKAEGAADKPAGPRLTTAELIAGASAQAPRPAPAAKKKNLLLVIFGAVVALVVIGAAIFYLSGKKGVGEGNESGPQAVKKGDLAFKQRKYIAANDLYNEAIGQGENPANHKKASDEAKGEESYNDLEAAISAGNFDRARTLSEKCSTESTFWCQKAQEKGEAVKAGYAKAHLAKATAAKATNAALCTSEVNLVLAFDPSNSEAQSLAGHCNPEAVAEPPKPKVDSGPSQAVRDAKATALVQEGNQRFTTRDFDGAAAKYNDAVAQKPNKTILGLAYRGLGTTAANKGDTKGAVKWFRLYLPLCDAATRVQVQNIIDRYVAVGG